MSRPDLKIVAQSILFRQGIFPIEQKEECRTMAEKLVQLIESCSLIVS